MNMSSNFSMYHEAVKRLIGSVFSGQVVLEQVDTAYDNAVKQVRGQMKFPFISIYPTPISVTTPKFPLNTAPSTNSPFDSSHTSA